MPLRYVVDDDAPVKKAAGGAVAYAKKLPADDASPPHEGCATCALLGGTTACYGVINYTTL